MEIAFELDSVSPHRQLRSPLSKILRCDSKTLVEHEAVHFHDRVMLWKMALGQDWQAGAEGISVHITFVHHLESSFIRVETTIRRNYTKGMHSNINCLSKLDSGPKTQDFMKYVIKVFGKEPSDQLSAGGSGIFLLSWNVVLTLTRLCSRIGIGP
jgi:hypothetical protein